jgi:hypothetical protein
MKIQKPIIAPPVSSKKIWDTISLPKGEIVIPLFGKWFDETHHPEHVEGEGLAPWSGESYSTGRGEIF